MDNLELIQKISRQFEDTVKLFETEKGSSSLLKKSVEKIKKELSSLIEVADLIEKELLSNEQEFDIRKQIETEKVIRKIESFMKRINPYIVDLNVAVKDIEIAHEELNIEYQYIGDLLKRLKK